ncbi:MAG: 30S ribosomal protein S16, partial [Myxococcota bacterium]
APRDGRFIERIGWFDPKNKTPEGLKLDLERAQYWIRQGAQPTDKVKSLIEKATQSEPQTEAANPEASAKAADEQSA